MTNRVEIPRGRGGCPEARDEGGGAAGVESDRRLLVTRVACARRGLKRTNMVALGAEGRALIGD